jgi:hypothetical protein
VSQEIADLVDAAMRTTQTSATPPKYTPSQRVQVQLDRSFLYHAPQADQVPRYNRIRSAARGFAALLAESCPESRELSLALTHLEEAVMFANAAIARNEAMLTCVEPTL